MAATTSTARPQVIITVIVGAVLALLASCGVYAQAQPNANPAGKSATFVYGSQN